MTTKDSTDEEVIDILLPVEDLRRENADLRAAVVRLRAALEYVNDVIERNGVPPGWPKQLIKTLDRAKDG